MIGLTAGVALDMIRLSGVGFGSARGRREGLSTT